MYLIRDKGEHHELLKNFHLILLKSLSSTNIHYYRYEIVVSELKYSELSIKFGKRLLRAKVPHKWLFL